MSFPLPTFRRFSPEDYKESQPWFQRFIQSLNLYTEPIWTILNGNFSPFTNANEELYSFQITAGASATNNTLTFAPRRFVGTPSGITIAQCLPNSATATAVGNPVTLDWYWNGTQIQILAVYGLTNGTAYNLTLRIY